MKNFEFAKFNLLSPPADCLAALRKDNLYLFNQLLTDCRLLEKLLDFLAGVTYIYLQPGFISKMAQALNNLIISKDSYEWVHTIRQYLWENTDAINRGDF